MPTYGMTVRWTKFGGNRYEQGVSGCETAEEAQVEAYRWAILCGWTSRRWWQWWRWNDTPNPPLKTLFEAMRREFIKEHADERNST